MLLLVISGVPAAAQQSDFDGQDLSVGESEYDTPPSVANELERDLSGGDDEYDTPVTPDPPAVRPSVPWNNQTYFDGEQTVANSTTGWNVSRSNIVWASVLAAIGAAGYAFLWFFAEISS